jgi:RHS repeat-associated protein
VRRSKVNALGQLVRLDEPVANTGPGDAETPAQPTSYTYDILGNLIKVTQGAQQRFFKYDSLSRLIRAKNPEQDANSALALTDPLTGNGQWALGYTYDNNGNLATKVDARNVTTTYGYDALNRAMGRTYSDSTPAVTYVYDTLTNGKGRLSSVSSSVSTTNYLSYDALGRVTGSSQVIDGVTYSMPDYKYDLAGNLTSQTYPSGRVVTTTFDNAGRLSHVDGQKTGESNKTYISSPTYSAHGAMTEMKLGLHLWEHTIFNSRLQPALIGLGTVQNVQNAQDFNRFRVDYAYNTPNQADNNGNVRQQTISVPDSSGTYLATLSQYYEYDELNRLKTAVELNGSTQSWKQSFVYDRYGNRTFNTGTGQTTSNVVGSLLTIDPSNNRITANQGYILYDNAGNLTRDFEGHIFSYDAENKQATTSDGFAAGGTDYKYDGDGRRVKKINGTGQATTIFVYNAMEQMVAEYSNTPAASGSGGTSYLTSDPLGTPRAITDADGEVKSRHDYLPFGEELSYNLGGRSTTQKYTYGTSDPDNVRQKFTQKERDLETGLDYFNARYYSSTQGRFTGVDPENAGASFIYPQSWNGYVYSLNNPLTYIDSNGLRWAQIAVANGVRFEWFDDNQRDASGQTEYDRALASGWAAVSFNESQSFSFTNGTLAPGETLTTFTLNPDGKVDRSDHKVSGKEWLKFLALATIIDNVSVFMGRKDPGVTNHLLSNFVKSLVGKDTDISLPDLPQIAPAVSIGSSTKADKMSKKADDLISGSLKKSRSYRSELGQKTYKELLDLAKKGGAEGKAAQGMKKLIEQAERLRDKVKGK